MRSFWRAWMISWLALPQLRASNSHPRPKQACLYSAELSAFWLCAGTMVVAQYLACLCDIAACLSGSSEVAELAHCTDNIAQVGATETVQLAED